MRGSWCFLVVNWNFNFPLSTKLSLVLELFPISQWERAGSGKRRAKREKEIKIGSNFMSFLHSSRASYRRLRGEVWRLVEMFCARDKRAPQLKLERDVRKKSILLTHSPLFLPNVSSDAEWVLELLFESRSKMRMRNNVFIPFFAFLLPYLISHRKDFETQTSHMPNL